MPQITPLDIGLVTTLRAHQVPPGGAQTADNVRLYPQSIRKALGTKRILNSRVDAPMVILDGVSQYFFGRVHATSTSLAMTASEWLISIKFKLSWVPATTNNIVTLIYKGLDSGTPAAAANLMDWSLYLQRSGTRWLMVARFSDGTNIETVNATTDSDGESVFPGVSYQVVFGRESGNWVIYLHKITSAIGSATTVAVSGGWLGMSDNASSDLYVGAVPAVTYHRDYDRCAYHFPGTIQEIIFDLTAFATASDFDAYAEVQRTLSAGWPTFVYPLTGWNGSQWPKILGGTGVPTLTLHPITNRWSTLDSATALDFDGHRGGFPVRDSYRWRKVTTSLIGTEGELDVFDTFGIFATVKIGDLREQCIFQWVHFTDDDEYRTNWPPAPSAVGHLNGEVTLGGTPEIGNLLLQVVPYSGSYYLRFVVWIRNKTVSTYECYAVSSAAISANTTYDVFCYVSQSSEQIRIFVNGTEAAASPVSTNTSVAGGATAGAFANKRHVPRTEDDPIGSRVKYWFEVGRPIKESRRGDSFPGDPNDVDVRYHTDKHFYGQMRQLGVVVNSADPSYVAQFLANKTLTRGTAKSVGGQVVMMLPMDEGQGDNLTDFGAFATGAGIVVDTKHQQGKSLITTEERHGVKTVANYEYRDAAATNGYRKKGIAVAGASIYEFTGGLGTSATTLTWLADGLRNDNGVVPSVSQFRDSLVICTDKGNYQLWRDQLWKLSIEPPNQHVVFGIRDCGSKKANLKKGRYRYAFTFYNAHLDKESAPGVVIEVVGLHGKFNVDMGEGGEVNQTYPRTGDSINKADYDMSAASCIIKGQAWFGTSGAKASTDPGYWESQPGSGGANASKLKRVVFTDSDKEKNTLIKKKVDVNEFEVQAVVEDRARRIRCNIEPDGTVELQGRYPGTHGFLRLENSSGANLIGQGAGIIGFTGVTAGSPLAAQWQGDGETDGPPLPSSGDPQVTHLRIYRTTADGGDLRLLAELPNGVRRFVDNIPDNELIGPLLEISAGAVPVCRYSLIKDGTAFYWGDPYNPGTLYWSKPNKPWNVPPQHRIDITDGKTLPLRMAVQTETTVALMKDEITLVLNPGGGGSLPFSVENRINDIGACSPFGAEVVEGVAYYPAEKGFYKFDGTTPRYISKHIEPTWQAIPEQYRDRIIAAHYRPEEDIYYFCPSGDSSYGSSVINDLALVLSYSSSSGASWTRRTGFYAANASFCRDSNGKNRLYIVEPCGHVSVMGNYGAYGPDTSIVTSKTAAAGGSTTTVVVSQLNSATYPDGYLGMPVTVVFSDGTRETRLVVADDLGSPSTLTLDHALSATTSAGGQTLIFGSIESSWVSGEMAFDGDNVTHLKGIYVDQEAQSQSANLTVKYAAFHGQNSNDAEQSYTIPNTTESRYDHVRGRGRTHRISLELKGIDCPFEVTGLSADVQPADRGKAHGGPT